MRLPRMLDEGKWLAEFAMQFARAIAHHGETAALRRTVRCESGDDDVAPRLYRAHDGFDVIPAILRIGEKVEYSPVVPDIETCGGQIGAGDVCLDPTNLPGTLPESLLRFLQRRSREIQHRYIRVSLAEKIIDKRRGAAADVDNAGIPGATRVADKAQ